MTVQTAGMRHQASKTDCLVNVRSAGPNSHLASLKESRPPRAVASRLSDQLLAVLYHWADRSATDCRILCLNSFEVLRFALCVYRGFEVPRPPLFVPVPLWESVSDLHALSRAPRHDLDR